MGNFKVNDVVRHIHHDDWNKYVKNEDQYDFGLVVETGTYSEVFGGYVCKVEWFTKDGKHLGVTLHLVTSLHPYKSEDPLPVEIKQETVNISDGGPSGYYDFPESWNTFNDFIEYKSVNQWKGFSFHLGNIGKAICRWGDKDGASIEYDAKKIIYSGCRVLMMIVGKEKLREYLNKLLEDEQFK